VPPPFEPNRFGAEEGHLNAWIRKFYLFVEGGNPNLNQGKREQMYIDMLETIGLADAEMMIAVKDKCLPWPEITYDLVAAAYPGMLPDKPEGYAEKTWKPTVYAPPVYRSREEF